MSPAKKTTTTTKKPPSRMMAVVAHSVDDYINKAYPETRNMMRQLRGIIKDVAPTETEEVISYRMPMYKYKGMLLGYASFERHVGFYAISQAILKRHKAELEGYVTGKGSLQLPIGQKLPVQLIRAMIRERVEEKDAAAAAKAAKAAKKTPKKK